MMTDSDAFLAMLLILTGISANHEYEGAMKNAAKAYYKQVNLDDSFRAAKKMYINKDMEKYGGAVAIITKMAVEQKLIVTWTF